MVIMWHGVPSRTVCLFVLNSYSRVTWINLNPCLYFMAEVSANGSYQYSQPTLASWIIPFISVLVCEIRSVFLLT